MELERSKIEQRNFSSTRRGYDQDEVDRHLREIADAVEELKKTSAAGTVGRRVQGVIEAAEHSAAEIEAAARKEAEKGQDRAKDEATVHVEKAEQSASSLQQTVAQLDQTIQDALAKLREQVGAPATPAAQGAQQPAQAAEPAPAGAPAADATPPAESAPTKPQSKGALAAQAAKSAKAGKGPAPDEGPDGPRLIALNMALNGVPREETARYLAENFELDDPKAMLDDVYARAS